MSTEENYLDNLLKAVTEPKPAESKERVIEETKPSIPNDEISIDAVDISDTQTEQVLSEAEVPEYASEIVLSDLETTDVGVETEISEDMEISEDIENGTDLEISDIAETEEGLKISDIPETEGELEIPDIPEIEDNSFEMPDIPEIGDALEIPDVPEIGNELEILDVPEIGNELEISDISGTEEDNLEIPDIPEIGDALEISDIPEIGDELKIQDSPQVEEEASDILGDISIDGLDSAIEAATELEIASTLNVEELELGDNDELKLEDIDISDINLEDAAPEADKSISDELGIGELGMDSTDSMSLDDDLDEVLNMLDADSDSDLAEINNMLKKSDNNEPIQDDMMDLLNQMADNEAAFVNAEDGVTGLEEGGVPLSDTTGKMEKILQNSTEKVDNGKASKKKKKKGNSAETEPEQQKKPGAFSKLFNALTEDLVPEPTEEELAAEKEAKEAKKQENLTKKEEEKAAKEEAKKAKAEEKEAAKKAKAEAADQKKKEKKAAKDAKLAAKRAKEEAAGPKPKRIPPKKIAIAAAFGVSVCGAVIVATNVLSTQGYLQKARNAYYEGDYKTVYLSTYGMELDGSDQLIQAKSATILKIQRRYDAYQTNLKMGREVEALNALVEGLAAYDYINADAEQYGVLSEVQAIRDDILNILYDKYGLDEAGARELLQNEDTLAYTIALNNIINGN